MDTIGWMDFCVNKLNTYLNVPNFARPLFEISLNILLLIWRRAFESFECYPKMCKGHFFINFLEPVPGGNVFFNLKKLLRKTQELFYLDQV